MSIQLERYMRHLRNRNVVVTEDDIVQTIKESKEPLHKKIKITSVNHYQAQYKDKHGRWMHAGYHDTPEEAQKAALKAHHENHNADHSSLVDDMKRGPARNPYGE